MLDGVFAVVSRGGRKYAQQANVRFWRGPGHATHVDERSGHGNVPAVPLPRRDQPEPPCGRASGASPRGRCSPGIGGSGAFSDDAVIGGRERLSEEDAAGVGGPAGRLLATTSTASSLGRGLRAGWDCVRSEVDLCALTPAPAPRKEAQRW
jgi:hypothetical protein